MLWGWPAADGVERMPVPSALLIDAAVQPEFGWVATTQGGTVAQREFEAEGTPKVWTLGLLEGFRTALAVSPDVTRIAAGLPRQCSCDPSAERSFRTRRNYWKAARRIVLE